MSTIQVKAFITQKDGDFITCQDRFSVDIAKGRFAVADGVSNSYHPEITAQALCEYFAGSDTPDNDWPFIFHSRYHAMINERWNREVKEYESTLTGRQLRHAMYKREDLPPGASTFAGISLNSESQSFIYHILGDSALFLVYEDEPIQCICTSPSEVSNGINLVKFGIHPDCILADGQMIGNWRSGEIAIKKGYIAIMTDGIAEWLQDALLFNKSALNTFWEMNNHDEFDRFVNDCRKVQKMDDDIAIVILKIDEGWDGSYEPTFLDKLPKPTITITNGSYIPTTLDKVIPSNVDEPEEPAYKTIETEQSEEPIQEQRVDVTDVSDGSSDNMNVDTQQETPFNAPSFTNVKETYVDSDSPENNIPFSEPEKTKSSNTEDNLLNTNESSIIPNTKDSVIGSTPDQTSQISSEADNSNINENRNDNVIIKNLKKMSKWFGPI